MQPSAPEGNPCITQFGDSERQESELRSPLGRQVVTSRQERSGAVKWSSVSNRIAMRRFQIAPDELSWDRQRVQGEKRLDWSPNSMNPTDDPSLITRVEHETWERCAREYVGGFGALVGESITPLLDAACVVAHSRVLDVGTGPGFAAAAVRDRQATAVGIDFSEAMIAEARRRNPDIDSSKPTLKLFRLKRPSSTQLWAISSFIILPAPTKYWAKRIEFSVTVARLPLRSGRIPQDSKASDCSLTRWKSTAAWSCRMDRFSVLATPARFTIC